MNPAAEAARAKPVPLWRWGAWWLLLLVAGLVFYFLLAPIWLGLRAAAWLAEFRARSRKNRHTFGAGPGPVNGPGAG